MRRDLMFLGLAAACWGFGTVISKQATAEMAPLVLLPIQLAASVLALILLMRRARIPLRGSPPLLARLGLLNPGLAYALGLIGLAYIPASLYVLLWAAEPLLIMLLAGIFLGEGISARFILLSAIAAIGMGLIVFEPAAAGQWLGVALTLAGVACCAAYTIIARRWVGVSDSTAQVVLGQQAYALALAIVVGAAAVIGGAERWSGLSPTVLGSAVVSGLLYYAAAYWFYLGALRTVPASIAATSFYLIPAFGVAASFAVLGERLDIGQWIGVAVVVGAVLMIVRLPQPSVAVSPVA